MKKTLISLTIAVSTIIILSGFYASLKIYKNSKEKELLKNEIIAYSNKDLVNDEFSITIKSQGTYAYIEQAAKNYYKNLSDNIKIINQYINDKDFANILTVENLKKGKLNFVKSHIIINNTKNNVNNAINKITNLCEENTINNLIDKNQISKNEYELFLNIMYQNNDIKELNETKVVMQKLSTNLTNMLDKIDEILNFFENNISAWTCDNNNIYFENEQLAEKYNKLYKELDYIINNFNYNNNDNNTQNIQRL